MPVSGAKRYFVRGLCAVVLAIGFHVPAAQASIVVGGTRVVFPAQDKSTTVRIFNKGTYPALVQAWIDKGNPKVSPDQVNTPFLVTPPLFRLDPHQSQSLRIVFVQNNGDHTPLPSDRETLFWLNVLEVPPNPTGPAAKESYLQFAVRSRLKLFYRPDDLDISRPKAPGLLVWHAAAGKSGTQLKVKNPTPYYITFSKDSIKVNGKAYDAGTGMVAPFDGLVLTVDGLLQPVPPNAVVQYSTISDLGGQVPHKGHVQP